MNRIFNYLTKWFCFFIIFISGCSIHHSSSDVTAKNLKKVCPHYVSVKNGQIEYYQFGKGSPLILIPGYATDVTSWNQKFLIALAQQHQVIVLNNRNVGGSWIQSPQYETTDLANDIYQLIQQLNLKKPAILGISMGGMIAQQLAVLHQDQLGQLILINTTIAGKKSIHPNLRVENKLRSIPSNKFGFYCAAIDMFFPSTWKMPMAYSLIADRFLPQQLNEINSANVMAQQQHLITHWIEDDLTAKKIGKLQLPTMILNGEADIVLPPNNSLVLATTIPHARLIRWRDGGHAMIYQYPRQIARNINEFISETS